MKLAAEEVKSSLSSLVGTRMLKCGYQHPGSLLVRSQQSAPVGSNSASLLNYSQDKVFESLKGLAPAGGGLRQGCLSPQTCPNLSTARLEPKQQLSLPPDVPLTAACGQTRDGEVTGCDSPAFQQAAYCIFAIQGSLLAPRRVCRSPGKSGVRELPGQVQRFRSHHETSALGTVTWELSELRGGREGTPSPHHCLSTPIPWGLSCPGNQPRTGDRNTLGWLSRILAESLRWSISTGMLV